MLVFGDRVRTREPRVALAELAAAVPAISAMAPGLVRHAALVGAFIEAAELAQGLADREHPAVDGRGALDDAAMRAVVALARAVDASWTQGAQGLGGPCDAAAELAALSAHRLPETIATRRAEGYAFYALYPEAYLAAGRAAPVGHRQVIGIRSIGLGLSAIVAVATGAPLPSTVRPRGDPFQRRVEVDPALLAGWLADGEARLAIVDEGPGMSGSSFGAVADVLECAGVARGHIECFPSHAGELGPAASESHRARWRTVARHVVDADALLVQSGALARWIGELVGPVRGPLEDLSAGAWRARHFASEADWPPAVRHQERRKLLAHTASGPWLARFVGLGRDGDRALARAGVLHRAGFTPEVAGLCHGFLVERWIDATPLSARALERLDRDARRRLVDHVGRYLGCRARALPAAPDAGATLGELAEMAEHNARLALGAAPRMHRPEASLAARAHPVEIDGRLHAWEWLVGRDGALIKADAYDHHAAHDLVGCQDIAWDLAGAAVELALSASDQARLITIAAEAAGRAIDPELLAFLRPCYLAFQLGRHALAATADPEEAPRLRSAADRYASQLSRALQRPCGR